MFRKIAIAISALAVVGAAALAFSAQTPAAANSWHTHRQHHNWRPAIRFSNPSYGFTGSCYVERVVFTPYGPRVTYVNVCF